MTSNQFDKKAQAWSALFSEPMSDLVKRYKGATRNAVDGISFDVAHGSLFALLGPNGAGKTTTISILTTTLAATSGSVQIAGADLAAVLVRKAVGLGVDDMAFDVIEPVVAAIAAAFDTALVQRLAGGGRASSWAAD